MKRNNQIFIEFNEDYTASDFFQKIHGKYFLFYCHRVSDLDRKREKELKERLMLLFSSWGQMNYVSYLDEQRHSIAGYFENNQFTQSGFKNLWEYYETIVVFMDDSLERWDELKNKIVYFENGAEIGLKILQKFNLEKVYSKLDETMMVLENTT